MNKKYLHLVCILFISISLNAQIKHALRDNMGRHIIVRGYVVTTNDQIGEVFFTPDDYVRMVRMGANYQVIRLEYSKLEIPSNSNSIDNYLLKLDSLVAMGQNVGIQTVFKMTTYGMKNFSWEKFWLNNNNENKTYIETWKTIWNRYKDNPSVVGYDLLNEPRKLTMNISYNDLTNNFLIPFYQLIIDENNKINATKICYCQSIFMNKGEGIDDMQYSEITKPIKRANIIFAPHIYINKKESITAAINRYNKESDLQNAKLLFGEWGFPTFDSTDSTLAEQWEYRSFYIKTTDMIDSLGIGTIKAWFSGNRTKQHFMKGGPSTWAIFSDYKSVGTVERKYITDIIARPYPQAIAGDILSLKFDHATRSLSVKIKTDKTKGESQIFIGADRHYPDGFSIIINKKFNLYYNPLKPEKLVVYQTDINSNSTDFVWNNKTQQLIIKKWHIDKSEIDLKIVPGIKIDN